MNERNISECKFSHDIVPYMYGEFPAQKSSVFESHLLDCTECRDEFAAISSARFEVYDWKKLEFDPLPTPRFAIPYSGEAAGVIDRLRAAFARGWAVPGLAFAGLVVISVSAAIMLLSGDNGTTSLVAEVGNANVAVVSATLVDVPPQVKPPVQTAFASGNTAQRRPEVLKASEAARQNGPRRIVRDSKSIIRAAEAKQAAVQTEQKAVPRLNGFPEDEDTSLRLAELFEDVETRD